MSRTLVIALGTLLFGAGASYLLADWSAPTQAPPGGNVLAPLNVGAGFQEKAGNLLLNSGISPNVVGLAIANGGLLLGSGSLSSVIGAPGETLKIDVAGAIGATKYCDENGGNCKTINEIGGGGGGACTYDSCRWTGCSDTAISCAPHEIFKGINPQKCRGNVAASIECCTMRCGGAPLGQTPTTAVCGSANGGTFWQQPTSGLCAVGGAINITGGGPSGWTWTCDGPYGGADVSCRANWRPANPVSGQCGSAHNTDYAGCDYPAGAAACASGNRGSEWHETSPWRWRWSCYGSEGGGTAVCWARDGCDYSGGSGSSDTGRR